MFAYIYMYIHTYAYMHRCQSRVTEQPDDAGEWEQLAGAYSDCYDWHHSLEAYHQV